MGNFETFIAINVQEFVRIVVQIGSCLQKIRLDNHRRHRIFLQFICIVVLLIATQLLQPTWVELQCPFLFLLMIFLLRSEWHQDKIAFDLIVVRAPLCQSLLVVQESTFRGFSYDFCAFLPVLFGDQIVMRLVLARFHHYLSCRHGL